MRVDEVTMFKTPDGVVHEERSTAEARATEIAINRLAGATPQELVDLLHASADRSDPLRLSLLWYVMQLDKVHPVGLSPAEQ